MARCADHPDAAARIPASASDAPSISGSRAATAYPTPRSAAGFTVSNSSNCGYSASFAASASTVSLMPFRFHGPRNVSKARCSRNVSSTIRRFVDRAIVNAFFFSLPADLADAQLLSCRDRPQESSNGDPASSSLARPWFSSLYRCKLPPRVFLVRRGAFQSIIENLILLEKIRLRVPVTSKAHSRSRGSLQNRGILGHAPWPERTPDALVV